MLFLTDSRQLQYYSYIFFFLPQISFIKLLLQPKKLDSEGFSYCPIYTEYLVHL